MQEFDSKIRELFSQLDGGAEAAGLFKNLPAADQAAIIQQMKALIAKKVDFCKEE